MSDSPEKIEFLDMVIKYMVPGQEYTCVQLINLYKIFSGAGYKFKRKRTVVNWLKSDSRIHHYRIGRKITYILQESVPVLKEPEALADNYADLEKLATIIPQIVIDEVKRVFTETAKSELLKALTLHIDTTLKQEFREDLIPSMIATVNDKVESKAKELDKKILQSARALRTAVDGQFRKIKAAIE